MGKSERSVKYNPLKIQKEKALIIAQNSSVLNLNTSSSLNQKEFSKNNIISSNIPKITVAPFGSTSIKTTLNPLKFSEDPGPGSYEGGSHPIVLSNSSKIKKKFFITGESRFKTSDNKIPGVGEYDINIFNNKFINKYYNTPNRIRSLHDFILNEKINTLPDKLLLNNNFDDAEFKTENKSFNNNSTSKKNILSLKHNNAIDWKKVSKKTLDVPFSNKINNINNANMNNDFIMLTEFNIISNKQNLEDEKEKIKKSTQNKTEQNIFKNNILGFKDNFDSKCINLTTNRDEKQKQKNEPEPGPGAYDPKNENFKIEPKKNKFQNFGTYESRHMFPISNIKRKINFSDSIKNKYILNKNNDSKNKLNKYKRLLHNLRINIIQEQSNKYKKNIQNNLGPGSYSPDNYFNISTNNIKFLNFSKTINTAQMKNEEINPSYFNLNTNPGVGEYDVLGEFKKNIEYNLSLVKSKKNKEIVDHKLRIEKFKKNRKKNQKKIYFLDYVDTYEYKMKKFYKDNNIYRPPFNSAVPKFTYEKINYNNDYDDINIDDVDNNRDLRNKNNNNINIPFLSRAKRWNSIEKYGGRLGPGTYEQKSFFDWNKRSFNVQYKLK